MSTLELRGVTVRYGHGSTAVHAVDDVDLVVPDETVVGLVGESGSGKSTLGKAIVGLAPPTAGHVLLDGVDLGTHRHRRGAPRPVQMVFQDPYSSLDPRMRIGDSIAEALTGVRGRSERAAEVNRLLELVTLDPVRARQLPGALSGGQRQRVALARALAARPRVVVADEITSALDVSVQGAVLNLVRSVQRELRLSMLFISHNLSLVRYVSDVVAVMYAGRVVEVGPTDAVLAAPQHPYTQSLLDAAPRMTGVPLRAGNGTRRLVSDPVDPHDPPPGCRFHPRCGVGPMVRTDRDICRTRDPQREAADRTHHAACHFAGDPTPTVTPTSTDSAREGHT